MTLDTEQIIEETNSKQEENVVQSIHQYEVDAGILPAHLNSKSML
jgi:hypothetical protein